MKLFLEDFGEEDSLDLHYEPSEDRMAELLEDTEYHPEGGFEVDLRAQRSGTTIRLKGTIAGTLAYRCGRCLEERDVTIDADTEFVLLERGEWVAEYEEGDETELSEEDLDVSYYQGEEIDLADLVREAILLELPAYPVCGEGDRERCDAAYEENVGEEVLEQNEEQGMDMRWAPLKDINLKE